ncbi:sensor histidine kinase [Simiduia aestuariiviva]|uniref:histidine kinase n=1 Tax=Simiduia aestuariiviva TaxID=1510459 RepID=A0A839UUE8_9GAMM|nr:PAS domain-containing protein [Simiduia aestuariiviva]MBB3169606.1 PAS domain S-box-containing protein [Simiduia aestuariiviva]
MTQPNPQSLYASEEKEHFELLVQGTHIGIWDWVDLNHSDVYWSSSYFRLLGYENLAFKPSRDKFYELLHPDDRDAHQRALMSHLDDGSEYDIEHRLLKKNGSYSWFRSTGNAILNESGQPIRMLGIIEIIDQRKEFEAEKQSAQERFQLAIAGASVGVWDWLNVNRSEQFWSSKFYELLGYEDQEIASNFENFVSLLHMEDQQRLFNTLDAHFLKNQPFDMEYRMRLKCGTYHWFRGSGIASRNSDGSPARMVGSIEDIEDKKTAEQDVAQALRKLADSNRDLEQFAYAASHDLQEPLRTIASYLQLIERRYGNQLPDEAKEFFGFVTDGCKRMKELINDLLQLSQVRDDYAPFEGIDVEQMLLAMKENFITQYPSLKIDVHCEDAGFVYGINSLIQRLFSNFIGNAIKYRHPDRTPEIKIEARALEDKILVSFQDNGIGIDNRYFDNIFEIFQRLHSASDYPGTGIGLALCKKIVKLHKGTIQVSSTPDKGSCFTVALPQEATSIKQAKDSPNSNSLGRQ